MQTDIPLKRLTLLRAQDLLPLLKVGDATVLSVETQELPATATRLDNVLRLRSQHGQTFLHVIEWQGYNDPSVLWRVAGYLAWLGQRYPQTTIVGTLVYLTPAADVGETLTQSVDGQPIITWTMPCVRLWEQDAQAVLAGTNLGLVVLSPLMRNATEQLVEEAVTRVLNEAQPPEQNDLLAILGAFAESVLPIERFVQLVTKERLMATDLFSYLMQEKTAELEAAFAQKQVALEQKQVTLEQKQVTLEQEKVALEQKQVTLEQKQVTLEQEKVTLEQEKIALKQAMYQSLITIISARFPQTRLSLAQEIFHLTDPAVLQQLITTAAVTNDIAELERLISTANN